MSATGVNFNMTEIRTRCGMIIAEPSHQYGEFRSKNTFCQSFYPTRCVIVVNSILKITSIVVNVYLWYVWWVWVRRLSTVILEEGIRNCWSALIFRAQESYIVGSDTYMYNAFCFTTKATDELAMDKSQAIQILRDILIDESSSSVLKTLYLRESHEPTQKIADRYSDTWREVKNT